jgi:hypothetical protein
MATGWEARTRAEASLRGTSAVGWTKEIPQRAEAVSTGYFRGRRSLPLPVVLEAANESFGQRRQSCAVRLCAGITRFECSDGSGEKHLHCVSSFYSTTPKQYTGVPRCKRLDY